LRDFSLQENGESEGLIPYTAWHVLSCQIIKTNSCHPKIHVLHVSHVEMERDKEHVLGKVVLVQASEGEEDIIHLHWYKG